MAEVTCSVGGCDRTARARGWCRLHWGRWKRLGDVQAERPIRPRQDNLPPGSRCSVADCAAPHFARTWCKRHYRRWQAIGDAKPALPFQDQSHRRGAPCTVADCNRPSVVSGLCALHRSRLQRTGTTTRRYPTADELEARQRRKTEYQRRWKADQYRREPERMNARSRAWRQANPDRVRLSDVRKRRQRASAPTVAFTVDQLAAKIALWGHRCWICGADYEAIDHVKPLARGGWHMLANLRPICRSCNSSKGARWPFTAAKE